MNFFETVYKIVSEIPTGKVISYGGVAALRETRVWQGRSVGLCT